MDGIKPVHINTKTAKNVNTLRNKDYLKNPFKFAYDSGARLKISQSRIWGDYKFLYDKLPTVFDEVTNGAGSAAWSKPYVNLSVTNSGDYCLRKTFAVHPYRAGFPISCEMTFDNFGLQAGVTKEFGYFSRQTTGDYDGGYDGIRIMNDGTNYYLQIWNNGNAVYNVSREDWNDSMDGTTSSEIDYDFDNFSILLFDFLWLGGKGVRFFIFVPGFGFYNFHTIEYASTAKGVFMTTPCHPIQYGIRSTGGSGSFRQICTSVTNDGITSQTGFTRGVSTEQTAVTCAAITNVYPIIGVRMKSGYRDIVCILQKLSLIAATNDDFHYEVKIMNSGDYTNSGTVTWADVPGTTGIEYGVADGNSVVSNGYVIDNAHSQSTQNVNELVTDLDRFGTEFNGTSQELWLCVRPLSINLNIYASLIIKLL